MCEAHAYYLKNGEEKRILENVDSIFVEGDNINMINIFGEQKTIVGKIKSYNNQGQKIVLVPLD